LGGEEDGNLNFAKELTYVKELAETSYTAVPRFLALANEKIHFRGWRGHFNSKEIQKRR